MRREEGEPARGLGACWVHVLGLRLTPWLCRRDLGHHSLVHMNSGSVFGKLRSHSTAYTRCLKSGLPLYCVKDWNNDEGGAIPPYTSSWLHWASFRRWSMILWLPRPFFCLRFSHSVKTVGLSLRRGLRVSLNNTSIWWHFRCPTISYWDPAVALMM